MLILVTHCRDVANMLDRQSELLEGQLG